MLNVKFKIQSVRNPQEFVGKSYRYISEGSRNLHQLRTIVSYDKSEKKLWTNLETYLPLETFMKLCRDGDIKIESDV